MICPNYHVTLLAFFATLAVSIGVFHGRTHIDLHFCTDRPQPTAALEIICFCCITKGLSEGRTSIAEIIAWWE